MTGLSLSDLASFTDTDARFEESHDVQSPPMRPLPDSRCTDCNFCSRDTEIIANKCGNGGDDELAG
jgi:hypothetical protein